MCHFCDKPSDILYASCDSFQFIYGQVFQFVLQNEVGIGVNLAIRSQRFYSTVGYFLFQSRLYLRLLELYRKLL